jgi:hypothetical protein
MEYIGYLASIIIGLSLGLIGGADQYWLYQF